MADPFLKPLLLQNVTILQTNLNAEIDLIDTAVPNIDTANILEGVQISPPETLPLIECFQFGDADVDSETTNSTIIPVFRVVNRISLQAETEKEAYRTMDVYLTALVNTVIKGTLGVNQYWHLDGKADVIRLVGLATLFEARGNETIFREGAAIWEFEKEYVIA